MVKFHICFYIAGLLIFSGCATYQPQYADTVNVSEQFSDGKTIEQTFYLVGDAGNAQMGASTPTLKGLKKVLDTVSRNSYVLFLGDNIYPSGMPDKNEKERILAEHRLNAQLASVKNFKGEVIFISGNHDWYSHGIKGLKRQADLLEEGLGKKNVLLPKPGCGLAEIDISDRLQLVIADSQWFLENWDKHPGINDNCPDIKTRKQFLEEIDGILTKYKNKTVVFAIHHPLMTYGPHGGVLAAEKHLFPFSNKIPLPLLGTFISQVRKSGGISIQDRNNERYNELADILMDLAQGSDRVIFVSGHEHSLQYSKKKNIPQIVSGAGSKKSAAKLRENARFTYGGYGFAVLDVFTDGSSQVRYYSSDVSGNNQMLFNTEVHAPLPRSKEFKFPDQYPATVEASVYDKERTQKSNFYQKVWGEHYRYLYGVPVKTRVALLDTLYGGLTPIRQGGGNQTKSLRLADASGREYNMRAMKKSAAQFLQSKGFGVAAENDFENTLPEDLLLDFYTAAHPYAPLAISVLADATGIYHTNPKLYYVPKQKMLGAFNENFGDELYLIEERPMEAFENLESFGSPKDIESTQDLYSRLRKDEKYRLDERSYIRARLFDMLIGDWDRHYDQWRWAEFENEEGNRVFKPIPRDRDQVFSRFDGVFLDMVRTFISSANLLPVYEKGLRKLKWFNYEPLPLDRSLLENSGQEAWLEEAKYIQEHITDEVIEKAFQKVPEEAHDEHLERIISQLKERRSQLVSIGESYYQILSKLSVLTGTDKDDHIEVIREGEGTTRVKIYRIKNGEKKDLMVNRLFNREITKEIWIYGLDDDDVFEVKGKGKKPIAVRLIGGQNHDVYKIENGAAVKVYDHKSKKNTVKEKGSADFHFTDNYEVNLFNYQKDQYTTTTLLPGLGFNPDDGIKTGLKFTTTKYGFERNPFSGRHSFTANYYFATRGFEFLYDGETTGVFNTLNLTFGGKFTSANFARNFFGFGSDTPNFDNDLDFDFNRVKLSEWMGYVGFARRSPYGSDFTGRIVLQGIEVENTEGRFINNFEGVEGFFDRKFFSTAEVNYSFESYDEVLNPSRGMQFNLTTGYTLNLEDTERHFGYLRSGIIFYNPLTNNNRLVLKARAATQINFGDDFEFYQAPELGSNNGLRGFRNQRFAGNSSLVFNGDLKYKFNKFRTAVLPLQLSIYGGYDYGRVWADNDPFNQWQQSFGGGVILNSSNIVNGDFALFSSDDGLRFTFGFGYRF